MRLHPGPSRAPVRQGVAASSIREEPRTAASFVPEEPQTAAQDQDTGSEGVTRPPNWAEPGSADRLKYLLSEEGLSTQLIDQWSSSPERTWYLERRLSVYAGACVGLACWLYAVWVLTQWLKNWNNPNWQWVDPLVWGAAVAVAGMVILAWSTVPYRAARRGFFERLRTSARYRVEKALVDLRDSMQKAGPEEQLARMFVLNRQQLDEYQQLTRRQQRTAFALTWGAAVAALLILVAGSIVALRVGDQDKYITGGLTALGTLLSTFLGQTFFRGHERAVEQLNLYYLEPSLTGRMLAAERILRHFPDAEKPKYAAEIMAKILAWEFPLPKKDEGEEEAPETGKPSGGTEPTEPGRKPGEQAPTSNKPGLKPGDTGTKPKPPANTPLDSPGN